MARNMDQGTIAGSRQGDKAQGTEDLGKGASPVAGAVQGAGGSGLLKLRARMQGAGGGTRQGRLRGSVIGVE